MATLTHNSKMLCHVLRACTLGQTSAAHTRRILLLVVVMVKVPHPSAAVRGRVKGTFCWWGATLRGASPSPRMGEAAPRLCTCGHRRQDSPI